MWEVTDTDTGTATRLTHEEAVKRFGREEFKEIVLGRRPHAIALPLDANSARHVDILHRRDWKA